MAIGIPSSLGSATENSGDTNVALTLAAGVTIGNLIVIACLADEERTLSSVADSQSHTWTIDKQVTNTVDADTTGRSIAIASTVCTATMTTADTITVTHSGAGGTIKTLAAVKVTGSWDSGRVDQVSSNTGATAAWSSGATPATTVADELVIGAASMTDAAPRTSAPDGSYSELFDRWDTDAGLTMVYLIVSGTGAQTASGVWSAADQWAAAAVTYKEAGAAPAPAVVAWFVG